MTLIGDPKAMARRLRADLAERHVEIGHSEALELVARQFGARDWNTLAARRDQPIVDGHAIPILRVFDEAKAMEFYVDYLGFRLDWGDEDKGHEPMYAQLSRGEARLHLSGHHGDASPGSGVLLPIPDARAFQQGLQAKEYAYANPGVEKVPWGRLVTVIDPFSNRLVFHEPNDAARSQGEADTRTGDAAAPIVHRLWVACDPAQAFETFTVRFGEWWPHDAYSPGPITGVTVEPLVGSPVRMHKADGEDYVFGKVLVWGPPRHYAQSFTLAQDEAYPSRLDVTFERFDHGGGTRVEFRHGGWNPGNVDRRSGFSEWDVLLGRFAALANTRT